MTTLRCFVIVLLMVFMFLNIVRSDSQSLSSEVISIRKMLARKAKRVHEHKSTNSLNESKRLSPGGPDPRHH